MMLTFKPFWIFIFLAALLMSLALYFEVIWLVPFILASIVAAIIWGVRAFNEADDARKARNRR